MTTAAARIVDNQRGAYDYTLKWIVVGEPFAGKSSIVDRVAEDKFLSGKEPTVGIDFQTLRGVGDPLEPLPAMMQEVAIHHNPQKDLTQYKIVLWDCAGQYRFRSIVRSYLRQSHAVLVVFDVTDRESFERCDGWISMLRDELDGQRCEIILLGNKCDLPLDRWAVTEADARLAADQWGCVDFFLTSAATGGNLRVALNSLLTAVHRLVLSGVLQLRHSLDYSEIVQLREYRHEEDDHHKICFRCL